MVDRGDEHLERLIGREARRGHVIDDRLEERHEIGAGLVGVHCRDALARGGVHDRRVELLVVRFELEEQAEHLVMHAVRIGAGPVNFVYDDDRRAAERERFAQHEARLRHGAIEGVDHEQHAVHHAEDALHFAAEIGVTRGVDDIDLHAVPAHRRVLGEDRDATLALERVRVHHAFFDDLILAERPGLPEHFVHEGGFAVIDVSDDGDITDIHSHSI